MVSNRSFVLHIGKERTSKKFLKNGVPHGSVLAPLLFNIYTSDLPQTTSSKYIYADDIALMISSKSIAELNKTLSTDLTSLDRYFHQWRLKMNKTKTVSSLFHLANRLAEETLTVSCGDSVIPFDKEPKYLGVTLDRSLTFRSHIKRIAAKVSARISLLSRLAGTGWGAFFSTLRTAALALVYSTAEYCGPVWSRSAHTHTLDTVLNASMRHIAGCLRSTPTAYLPVLSGIPPPDIRRNQRCLQLAHRANRPGHLLHASMQEARDNVRLTSRKALIPHLKRLSDDSNGLSPDAWAMGEWTERWNSLPENGLHAFIDHPSFRPPGCNLDRLSWSRLNRLRTGHGRFRASMFRWGFCNSPTCECGESNQTADHILDECSMHGCPGRESLQNLDDDFIRWLKSTNLII